MSSFRWPGFDSTRKLSAEEAVDLAARVAELTKAGLPLGDGLRAMAGELPGRRLPRVLRAMAEQLDAGADLPAAIEAQGRRLPACLRGLVLAGVHSGRLPEVLEEYVDVQRGQLELRRRIWLCLAYPLFLLGALTALSFLLSARIVPQFAKIFMDFGTALPPITQWVLLGSTPLSWLLLAIESVFFLILLMFQFGMATRWIWPVLHGVPLFGPLLRWGQLVQFSRLMGLLLDQQVPLPDALRLAGAGVRDVNLAYGCRGAADDVESGRSLRDSLASRRQFPASLIPVIEWGQSASALPDAFQAAGEMFEGRIRSRGSILEALLLPIMLVLVVTFVGFVVIALFMPLISLITKLSGGH